MVVLSSYKPLTQWPCSWKLDHHLGMKEKLLHPFFNNQECASETGHKNCTFSAKFQFYSNKNIVFSAFKWFWHLIVVILVKCVNIFWFVKVERNEWKLCFLTWPVLSDSLFVTFTFSKVITCKELSKYHLSKSFQSYDMVTNVQKKNVLGTVIAKEGYKNVQCSPVSWQTANSQNRSQSLHSQFTE